MKPSICFTAITASIAVAGSAPAFAQTFPSVPRAHSGSPGAPNPTLLREFIMDAQRLSVPIDLTATNEADNQRIDREAEAYKELADKVSGDRYDGIPQAQRQPMLMGLKTLYDGAVASTAQEIEQANGQITGIGSADGAFSALAAYDAYLYAATKLFPGDPSYKAARQKIAGALGDLGGSREAAKAKEEAAALAKARNVRMPAPVTRDKGAQALFRQAWRTSGIPWTIMKINVTSGWRDKVEYGRVIGQRRDAAIAAKDPASPNRCNLYDFTMFRDKSGNVRRDSHSTKRIACENVK